MPLNSSTRRNVLIIAFSAIISIIFVTSFRSQPFRDRAAPLGSQFASTDLHGSSTSQASLSGHAIAPKLGNETLKAELGRASWKLFHTVMARFPESPTLDEREALRSYIHLFQRLYPCGECAEHFGQVLQKFPPQVSGRNVAAGWACHVHNEVNKSLQKPIFDCSQIGDFYDCGCAEDEKEDMNIAGSGKDTIRSPLEGDSLSGWHEIRS